METVGKDGGMFIGIIGSTTPSASYRPEMGLAAGIASRMALEQLGGGYVYTGGVEGVGVDSYGGVLHYAYNHHVDPKFFAIIPETYTFVLNPKAPPKDRKLKTVAYSLPDDYLEMQDLILSLHPERELEEIPAFYGGKGMVDRREIIVQIADALVMLNGSNGTLDEAIRAANLGIPLIVCEYSGGAARLLSLLVQGKELPSYLHEEEKTKLAKMVEEMNTESVVILSEEDGILNALKMTLR
jgi:hypothetical protein